MAIFESSGYRVYSVYSVYPVYSVLLATHHQPQITIFMLTTLHSPQVTGGLFKDG
jgi:hypothetical protein